MGSGIAQKLAQERFLVVLVDTEEKFLKKGLDSIRAVLNQGVERGIFSTDQVDGIMGRIRPSTDSRALGECQFVIEAIFEDFDTKCRLFSGLEKMVADESIVATNTSSFSVSDLARSFRTPGRFLGLHFFYHAAKNRLVEIIPGERTSDETFKRAESFVARIGKDAIVCKDSYGFAVNRFFVPWLNEGVRIFEEGIASPEEIDAACCRTFGISMGPFALMNATGVSIAYHAQKTLERGFGQSYRPAEALARQAQLTEPWQLQEFKGEVNQSLLESISHRMLGVVFTVCGQILDEGVTSPGELNRGARIGLKWRKGPVEWMRDLGEQKVQQLATKITQNRGITPSGSLIPGAWGMDFLSVKQGHTSAILTILRPEDLNALNHDLLQQLEEKFAQMEADDRVETIFVRGQGKAFMAGADIKFFIDCLTGKGNFESIRRFTENGQRVFSGLDKSKKRVVAVVNGLALGGGLELALTADIVVATDGAVLAFPETGLGIYPGLGGTVRTPRRVGRELAKYLIYTGTFLNARDAREIGLVDQILSYDEIEQMIGERRPVPQRGSVQLSPRWQALVSYFRSNPLKAILSGSTVVPKGLPEETARKMENTIRGKAPVALEIAEKLLDEDGGLQAELDHLHTVFSTADALQGLKSVGGKPPRFQGR